MRTLPAAIVTNEAVMAETFAERGFEETRMEDLAEASGVPVTVAVLGSGGCDEGRPDRRIAEVSGGRCLDAGDDVGASLHDEIARIGTGDD